jgi:hypothetical protein
MGDGEVTVEEKWRLGDVALAYAEATMTNCRKG